MRFFDLTKDKRRPSKYNITSLNYLKDKYERKSRLGYDLIPYGQRPRAPPPEPLHQAAPEKKIEKVGLSIQ